SAEGDVRRRAARSTAARDAGRPARAVPRVTRSAVVVLPAERLLDPDVRAGDGVVAEPHLEGHLGERRGVEVGERLQVDAPAADLRHLADLDLGETVTDARALARALVEEAELLSFLDEVAGLQLADVHRAVGVAQHDAERLVQRVDLRADRERGAHDELTELALLPELQRVGAVVVADLGRRLRR